MRIKNDLGVTLCPGTPERQVSGLGRGTITAAGWRKSFLCERVCVWCVLVHVCAYVCMCVHASACVGGGQWRTPAVLLCRCPPYSLETRSLPESRTLISLGWQLSAPCSAGVTGMCSHILAFQGICLGIQVLTLTQQVLFSAEPSPRPGEQHGCVSSHLRT